MAIFIGNESKIDNISTETIEQSMYSALANIEKGYRDILIERSQGLFASEVYGCADIAIEAINVMNARACVYLDKVIYSNFNYVGNWLASIENIYKRINLTVKENKDTIKNFSPKGLKIETYKYTTDKSLDLDKFYDTCYSMRSELKEINDMDVDEMMKMMSNPFDYFKHDTFDVFRGKLLYGNKSKEKLTREELPERGYALYRDGKMDRITISVDSKYIDGVLDKISKFGTIIKDVKKERGTILKCLDMASKFFKETSDLQGVIPLKGGDDYTSMVSRYFVWKLDQIVGYSTAATVALSTKVHAVYNELCAYENIVELATGNITTKGGETDVVAD